MVRQAAAGAISVLRETFAGVSEVRSAEDTICQAWSMSPPSGRLSVIRAEAELGP